MVVVLGLRDMPTPAARRITEEFVFIHPLLMASFVRTRTLAKLGEVQVREANFGHLPFRQKLVGVLFEELMKSFVNQTDSTAADFSLDQSLANVEHMHPEQVFGHVSSRYTWLRSIFYSYTRHRVVLCLVGASPQSKASP